MSAKAFLDTNVVVYAFDPDSPDKQRTARKLLAGNDLGRNALQAAVCMSFLLLRSNGGGDYSCVNGSPRGYLSSNDDIT